MIKQNLLSTSFQISSEYVFELFMNMGKGLQTISQSECIASLDLEYWQRGVYGLFSLKRRLIMYYVHIIGTE